MLKDKKILIRLIAFLIALGVAIFAFTNAILSLGRKKPGYYDVGLTAEGSAALYGSGVHFLMYAEGSSSDVRLTLNEAQKEFSDALLYAYKLLDARELYEGVNNLAVLNLADGQPVQVGETLYGVLEDALRRTQLGEGYSLFSGMLHHEWTALRYLEEPQDSDPLRDPKEAALLSDMAAMVSNPSAFMLTLTAPDTASFSISSDCRAFLEEQEIDAPLLDLNLLHDAYLLEMTAQALKDRGYAAGYLYSESGCSLWLERAGDMRYDLYGLTANGPEVIGAMAVPAPAAYCQFTAFPAAEERYGFYTVEADGRMYRRHAYINPATGGYTDLLMTAGLASGNASLVDLSYAMAVFNTLPDQNAVTAYIEGLPESVIAYYTLQQEPAVVYTNAAEQLALDAESGYMLK